MADRDMVTLECANVSSRPKYADSRTNPIAPRQSLTLPNDQMIVKTVGICLSRPQSILVESIRLEKRPKVSDVLDNGTSFALRDRGKDTAPNQISC